MLLQPLEEQFDLPPVVIELCDHHRTDTQRIRTSRLGCVASHPGREGDVAISKASGADSVVHLSVFFGKSVLWPGGVAAWRPLWGRFSGDLGCRSLSRAGLCLLILADKRMLEDIWAPLDLHETLYGVKGKLALAGNTWRARWKYKYFAEINWLHALWIQACGVLFDKQPRLD